MPKELLQFNVLREGDEWVKPWKNRAHEISSKQKFRKRPRETVEEYEKRYDSQELFKEKFQDFETLTGRYIKEGIRVCDIFVWKTPTLPYFILSKIGKTGELYLVDLDNKFPTELFLNFIKIYLGWLNVKRGSSVDPSSHVYTCLNHIKNQRFLRDLTSTIRPFVKRSKKGYYELTFDEEKLFEKRREIDSRKFFSSLRINPIVKKLPPYPRQIKANSLDVIIENDGFAFCDEKLIEEILYDSYRVLKRDGYLLFSEWGQWQAALEYYGQELFKNHYEREHLESLFDPHEWMIFRKVK